MPVQWTISHSKRLVLAVARSPTGAKDIETYLHSVALAGGMPYAKIFSIVDVDSVLSSENIAALADIVRHYGLSGPIGPVAIVAPFDRGYQQARQFADGATANRPLAIFRELHEARRWIDSLAAAHAGGDDQRRPAA
jgi:hypothetical protein